MTNDQIAVLFIVGKHSIAGALDHSNFRVLDMLNDASTPFLKVHDVAVFRGIQERVLEQIGDVTVPKAAIDCALLTDDRHEAPMRRQYALVEKQSHPAFVLLANYELRGKAMLERSADPVLLLNNAASAFFPVVAASLSSVDGKEPSLSASVVFVNKVKVSLLRLEK